MSFPRYERYKDSGVEWLGEVPERWQVTRLKNTTSECRNGVWGADANGDEWDIACVRVADFDRNRLCVSEPVQTLRNVTESERDGRLLRRGNLLLEKSGGGDLQPVGCVVLYDSEQQAVCSNFVARMEIAVGFDSSYCRYLHAAIYALRLSTRSINQTSGIQNLDQSAYLNEVAALPSEHEQTAVANFLDRETAKIDALIDEQRRLIELLKEKRQAVISHAVTKGLLVDVAMKSSGFQWLGEIPKHWSMTSVKRLSKFTTSGPRGWSDRISEDGSLFVQSGDLDDSLSVVFAGCKRVTVDDDAEATRTRLADGDIVVCITGAKTGKVAICSSIPEPAYVNQHLCLIRLNAKVLPRYLGLLLKSDVGRTYFDLSQYGLKQGLSLDDVRDAPVPLPSLAEQLEICGYIDSKATEFDSLIMNAVVATELLQERRSALISAAVTGKIDVRNYTPKEAA
jgi:type I restriction enzyme S subunit